MGLFGRDKNTAPGDESTGGLPKRINKTQRHKDQEAAAREERYPRSFGVSDRPGRPHGDYTADGR